MMRFDRDRWERQFLLSFNQAASRTDLLYAICLATFGLSGAWQAAHWAGWGELLLLGCSMHGACIPRRCRRRCFCFASARLPRLHALRLAAPSD